MAKYLPIEREIARELHIKPAQIMEWSTTPIKVQEGEILAQTHEGRIYVAYKAKQV